MFQNSPEISLHKAIITQAIIDASNVSDNKKAVKLESEAKNWIFGCGEYFKTICMKACIEPQLVIKITKQVIHLHKAKVKIKNAIRKASKPINIISKEIAEKLM